VDGGAHAFAAHFAHRVGDGVDHRFLLAAVEYAFQHLDRHDRHGVLNACRGAASI
jgi:hypothetical protein